MTQEELEIKVRVFPVITIGATFEFHKSNGVIDELEVDDFVSLGICGNNTYINYVASDDSIKCLEVQESVEEIQQLIKFAREKQRQAYGKYKIVENIGNDIPVD